MRKPAAVYSTFGLSKEALSKMCSPQTASAIGQFSPVGGAVLGYLGQNAAASANREAANISYAQNENAASQRYTQIGQEQSENTINAAIARARAEGSISASASSMGSDASTTGRQVQAADFATGMQLGRMDINSENQRIATADQEQVNWLNRQSQINSVAPQSPLVLGVHLAANAAQAAADYAKMGGRY